MSKTFDVTLAHDSRKEVLLVHWETTAELVKIVALDLDHKWVVQASVNGYLWRSKVLSREFFPLLNGREPLKPTNFAMEFDALNEGIRDIRRQAAPKGLPITWDDLEYAHKKPLRDISFADIKYVCSTGGYPGVDPELLAVKLDEYLENNPPNESELRWGRTLRLRGK